MKRVVEKVKDIVEICPFTHLHDFSADPGLTLAGYHFTDITADLMSKWIDRVSAVRSGQGSACALAGFRGVGKSHFLSVLGAIITRPELRSRISDSHVASNAERLSRRHGNVAFVRRGSGTTLHDELKRAIGLILETSPSELTDSLYDLLMRASDHSGEVPLVILIDTALGRDSRVSRDDGAVLSEIAEAAKAIGVFVGVALDDDISGADGPNASISGTYSIDYLDQEHLYKIVDSVIFSKHNHMRGVLHDIYEDYRQQMPGFRWSEQRFTSLYPLHPATVEIAPLVRLYIHDFALLGFAAEAGVKILGRPANSLIGLDEVFDGVEQKLRSVPDLQDVFSAFDNLEREVVGKTPVLFRHPAKLILKGLLILSLNGQGSTADEIAASMMIASSSDGPSLDVDGLLESCAEAMPKAIDRHVRDGAKTKYGFRIGSKADVESVLARAAAKVPADVVWKAFIAQSAEKWSDFDGNSRVVACNAEWRGSIRRGELIWPPAEEEETSPDRKDVPDWTIEVEPDSDEQRNSESNATAIWRIAKPTAEEVDAIKRHYLLANDAEVREQAGEALSTNLHVSAVAVEKAWNRVFFRDGHLVSGGQIYRFADTSRAAHSLSDILSPSLGPIFDSKYAEHPVFGETLGLKQVAELISAFLSGSESGSSESQRLAQTFALPLGLAERVGDTITPVTADRLTELKFVRAGFGESEGTIPLNQVGERLSASPYGLTREAQHVVLAALVAQKHFEFVTSSGNRINHRSLDLQIIWDDIVGLAKPLNEQFSAGRLLVWAKLITGNSALKSIDRPEDQVLITDSLTGWLSGWNQNKVLSEFDALPDDSLSASIWRTAANLRKSFGAMADLVDSLAKKNLSLDQCLQLIADLFSDSETEFEAKKVDLRVLRDFTSGVRLRNEIRTYLTLCENTGDEGLENSRGSLIAALEAGRFEAVNSAGDQFVEVWNNFRELYAVYYAERHDAVMKSDQSGERLKAIIRSEEWAAFEGLSSISWLDRSHFERARALVREMRQLHCSTNVLESLKFRPFCGCSFTLSETERLLQLGLELEATVKHGIEAHKKAFLSSADSISGAADTDAMRASIVKVIAALSEKGVPNLSSQDIRVLKLAAESIRQTIASNSTSMENERIEPETGEVVWEAEIRKVEDFVNTEI